MERQEEVIDALATLCSFIGWHHISRTGMMGARTTQEAIRALSIISGIDEAGILKVAYGGQDESASAEN